MSFIDLHTHTTASDGELKPAVLIEQARQCGLQVLAITDHDSVDGIDEVFNDPPADVILIPGVEISCNWERMGIHVVGLNFCLNNTDLRAWLSQQRERRRQRAVAIGELLLQRGISGAYAGALTFSGNVPPGRIHFADFLVHAGEVPDRRRAFKRYLSDERIRTVNRAWPSMESAIEVIQSAGGSAILAHPGRYRTTRTGLRRLVSAFEQAGGDAIELHNGINAETTNLQLLSLAHEFGLYLSVGSDFHRPGQPWAALGNVPGVERERAIWSCWGDIGSPAETGYSPATRLMLGREYGKASSQ